MHVVPSLALSHGGVSVSVRQLAQGLSRLGIETEIWTTPRGRRDSADNPADEALQRQGVQVRYFPVARIPWLGERWGYSPALGRRLKTQVGNFDLVQIHSIWLYPTWAAARACRRNKVPYLVSPCGALGPYGWKRNPLIKWLYGFLVERPDLGRANMIHFTAPLEERLSFRFGVKTPSCVIPRSIDLTQIPPVEKGAFRKKHPEIGGRKILLFLGRLHRKKGLDRLARLFSALSKKRGDLHLVVAGPEEGGSQAARQILRQAGLLKQATWTGILAGEEKWEAYRDSDFFLLPSHDENFAVTALEAMAFGLPVLVSKHVGISEAIQETQAGFVLEDDPAVWQETMELLLDNPQRGVAAGLKGRQLVEKAFSSSSAALQMKAVYDHILS